MQVDGYTAWKVKYADTDLDREMIVVDTYIKMPVIR